MILQSLFTSGEPTSSLTFTVLEETLGLHMLIARFSLHRTVIPGPLERPRTHEKHVDPVRLSSRVSDQRCRTREKGGGWRWEKGGRSAGKGGRKSRRSQKLSGIHQKPD